MKQQKGDGSANVEKQLEKQLDGMSDAEKVAHLMKRVVDAEKTTQEKTVQINHLNKANAQLEKKTEKSQTLLLKTEEAKCKLEELCRELNKHNKQIREEALLRAKKSEEDRMASVTQLKGTLKDIETSMQEGRGRSDQLYEDNLRLAGKLKELGTEYEEKLTQLADQYGRKEKYWEELEKARKCEIQLLKTKLEAAGLQTKKLNIEKEELGRTLMEGTARVGSAVENERILRDQVKSYSEKYSELTKSLSQSNSAFDKFKKEIDRVNSSLTKVQRDALKWQQKYEESNKSVLVLTVQKQEQDEVLGRQKRQVEQLEKLCRSLRAGASAEGAHE